MILLTSPRSYVLGSCSHWSFYFLYSSGSRNIQLFSTKAKRNFWTHNHTQSLLKRKQDKASHCRSLLWQLCQDRSGDGCVRLAKQTIRDGRNSTKAAGSRRRRSVPNPPERSKCEWKRILLILLADLQSNQRDRLPICSSLTSAGCLRDWN